MMEKNSLAINVITKVQQNSILNHTWHPSIDENDSWLHLGKTLFGKIHFRKIHFGKIYSYQFRSALFENIEWARLGRWEAAKKLDLRGVELGGKCTYTSEHMQQLFSN